MSTDRGFIVRMLKPLLAGIALAYLVTAFVDRPAPVQFQPRSPNASAQARIVEPQVDMVVEKNIMKLGSPLSNVRATSPADNPLARLEVRPVVRGEDDNATTLSPAPQGAGVGAGKMRGIVSGVPVTPAQ
ncbi:MAG: hypothetical protein KUA35_06255 [Pseudodesulfovibrio sp.]|uniref:Uncharacterized protein n=1 Tax=Pseudodesulfovibrio aespoeensis (strain ATCC 700646 / DSM 10631 / Aspo-2) TaxID=643562 RepID=E6VZA1_PSEA9|nr:MULTISPECIES: hypothetical protein [Pseudodesulfovibrio]MBU4192315.1 hypothetical protein [Pseudomonadota bacterium]ADU63973.1 hypothetical protein Daes_2979 [Pseudodesulfovibrio aespoeensis Aspo-2]MBU4244004.1 hypothetical protein [Pseudomonadota bacterium]MBU4379255.1 hypothetical protein [Pseudomonadota bacterium]MBU4474358.1 hypothetical protein [Pseudomonadota bacterium]